LDAGEIIEARPGFDQHRADAVALHQRARLGEARRRSARPIGGGSGIGLSSAAAWRSRRPASGSDHGAGNRGARSGEQVRRCV
jgi:hypothetical protein